MDKQEIQRLARLSGLALTESETGHLVRDLDRLLAYVDQLRSLATDDIPPTSAVLPPASRLRPDRVAPSLDREAALAGAPARRDDFFRVPAALTARRQAADD